jgi:N-methylhydantoinase B
MSTTVNHDDVIAVELHQRGVRNIAREMALTLQRTSGSRIVTESKDFSTCILDADGRQLAFSGSVTFHIATSVLGLDAVRTRFDAADIEPGDAFLCNDPHTSGAIHQGDVGVLMPYFHEGVLVAWGYVNEHVVDVGGMAVSGFAPGATDCFAEGLRFPGTRVARGGVLDPQWEEFIATNVRMPVVVLNDVRSLLAANNAGHRRITALIDRIGPESFRSRNLASQELSESAVRRIFAGLPDGTYDSTDWVEFDGAGRQDLYEVRCRLVVDGDQVSLQFRGDPQADAFINGAAPAVIGQAWATLMAQLLYDVPVNAGIWPPVTFDLGPRGTVVNSQPPAAVSMSHMETGMQINKLVCDVLSQACALSDDPAINSRVAGQHSADLAMFSASGRDRRTGKPVVVFPGSIGFGCGGGGQTVLDGLETYGSQPNIGQSTLDVEMEEASHPGMILWRTIAPDTGGPGTFRGGNGLDSAIAILESDRLHGGAFNSCSLVAPRGSSGGFPGSTADWTLYRETNILGLLDDGVLPTLERLEGTADPVRAKSGSLVLGRGDVFRSVHGGGGGVGDPLLRDPDMVLHDIRDGYVSAEHARAVYGIVLGDDGAVEGAATDLARTEIRRARLGSEPSARGALLTAHRPLTFSAGTWTCSACDEQLATEGGNWRTTARTTESEISEMLGAMGLRGRRRRDGRAVVAREHYCPSCASALGVDVTLDGNDAVAVSRPGTIDPLPREDES